MNYLKTIILVLGILTFIIPCGVSAQTSDTAVPEDDNASTRINTPVTIDVLANDSNYDATTLKITSGPSTGATATINTDYTITYTPKPDTVGSDSFEYEVCASGTSGCDTATVSIDIARVVFIDIKPGSCPNPINVKSWGVLPVAILGAEDFEVKQIDKKSITLAGVKPLWFGSSIEDVATPFIDDLIDCSSCADSGPDGYLDLTLKFSTQEIVKALGEVTDEQCVVLELTGKLKDGTSIVGEDVVRILKKGNSFGWGINTFEWPKWELPKFEWPKKK